MDADDHASFVSTPHVTGTLRIDYNNNKVVDEGIDIKVGISKFDSITKVCFQTMIDIVTSSTCSFYYDLYGEINFSATEHSSIPHVNYMINIPKRLLPETKEIGVTLVLLDQNGRTYIPVPEIEFSTAIEISW